MSKIFNGLNLQKYKFKILFRFKIPNDWNVPYVPIPCTKLNLPPIICFKVMLITATQTYERTLADH